MLSSYVVNIKAHWLPADMLVLFSSYSHKLLFSFTELAQSRKRMSQAHLSVQFSMVFMYFEKASYSAF